jgi:transglutaminase-like putative cysteine protease
MRLTSVSQFDGSAWTHAEGKQVTFIPGTGRDVPRPADTPSNGTIPVQAEVEIGTLRADWLPVPYVPTRVGSATGAWQVDQSDLTIAADGASLREQEYRVSAELPNPEGLQAGTVDQIPQGMEAYLDLPDSLPEIIHTTATEVTAGAGDSVFAQAEAIQSYFRDTDFVYSTKTPAEEGYDGDSGAIIARFLEVKSGYCVHFAAAMALMARSLGIPSRIAMGYLPGTKVSADGEWSTYSVKANQLHSWPELYLPGAGWVGFEPTVSRASAPSYAPGQSASATPSPSSSAPSSTAASPTAGQSVVPTEVPSVTGESTSSDETPGDSAWVKAFRWIAGALAALVVIGLLPAGWRTLRRVRRTGSLRGTWEELKDTAIDLGLGAPPAETPAEFGARLSVGWAPEEVQEMKALVSAVERAAYAAADADLPPEVHRGRLLRALRGSVPRVVRFWAFVAPRSLRRG